MDRVVALALMLVVALAPVGAWAQSMRPGGMSAGGLSSGGTHSGHRPPSHRPRPPFVHRPFPFFPCCVGFSYLPPEPPPVIVTPPPVIYVVPSPPSLTYVPTPRVEPALEVTLPSGRWARHGNGKEYPYTWVWEGAAPAR